MDQPRLQSRAMRMEVHKFGGTSVGDGNRIRRCVELVAKARQESEERNGSDDEPEDDGQPSEYEEWQDYMGGDEYYDHSENECW